MTRKTHSKSGSRERMTKVWACAWLLGIFLFPTHLFGQDRAVMTAPMVRSVEGVVTVVTQFSGFQADRTYRIGIGVESPPPPNMEIQLHRDGRSIGQMTEFQQAYVSHWWNVDQVAARGFVLRGSDLAGGELTLEIKIQKDELSRSGNLYLFISRDYGLDRFYLEDGSTIN